MIRKILFFASLLITTIVYAETCTSNGDGDWNDTETWDCGNVPGDDDVAVIAASHTVNVDCNCGEYSNFRIEVYGELHFNNGKKITMDVNGVVQIYDGGSITGGNGGSKIIIDGTGKWDGDDGPVSGPAFVDDINTEFQVGILPISLLSFDAILTEEKTVQLTWVTAQEINNDYFTIERSSSGISFEEIEEIPGAGNSKTELSYETYDYEPLEGVAYYRLKQTDFDGKYEYFTIIGVSFETSENGDCILKVYPNPCMGRCTITMSECEDNKNMTVKIQVLDASGHIITSEVPYTQSDGSFAYSINTSNNFAPGVYIIKAGANNPKIEKVIVK
ncbi:MAG: T9SS type A sorting domain-containing protein [Flavobacteriales bacterium]|nr:T9SS type A sorting domain-containing protein [Flavobacteriales bacterium]